MLRYATELLARRGAAAGAAGAISRRGLHGDALWMSTLSANDKTPSNPPPTTVHTVTGQDAKGIISKILDAVCSHGGTVVSSRSVRMGGSFSSVMLVRDADAAAVNASVSALPHVDSAASRPFKSVAMGQTTAKVQFVGEYKRGLASKAISYLCSRSRDVSVEKLDHRVLTNPEDPATEMLIMEGVLRVPNAVRGTELEEDLGKLGLTLRLMKN